jgi:coenzyme F420-0:L-glutamate ligase/coenzyme F420-1:gamma-L-glutamate ligase
MIHQLSLTALAGFPLVEKGDDLHRMITEGLRRAQITLRDGDGIVLAQKIVSKSEGRMRSLQDVHPSPTALELATETGKDPRLVELILQESRSVLRKRENLIIVEHRLGFVCANAGIDHSNVRDGWVLLLPEDPDGTARELREAFRDSHQADIGVMIIDSHGRAWRLGTVGVAIGVAGFPALVDMRGRPDLFNNLLQSTQVGLADEIAAAASALMGQADEGRPAIHVRGLEQPLRNSSLRELIRPEEEDLFR